MKCKQWVATLDWVVCVNMYFVLYILCRVCLSSRRLSNRRRYLLRLGLQWWMQVLTLVINHTRSKITLMTTSGWQFFVVCADFKYFC